MTVIAPVVRSQLSYILASVIGPVLCLYIVFYGLPVPPSWLFDLESLAFWLMIAMALLLASYPLLQRYVAPRNKLCLTLCGAVEHHRHLGFLLGPLALVGAFVAFSLPLASLWFTGKSTLFHLGGLLPWSDAAGYHLGGLQILEEGRLDWWNSRRPLNAAFMAGRLALMAEDLQLSLVIQTLVTALACFLAARALSQGHGAGCGCLMFALLYEYARPHVGTTMSASLGLSFGCLGFALLWNAHQQKRAALLVAAGATLLTLGLNARAGAFFVLPGIILWVIFSLRRTSVSTRSLTVWAVTGICIGFLLNACLYWAFGSPQGMLHSNFSYALYGLAVGGKGWSQIYTDHPEVNEMFRQGNPRLVAEYIYNLAFQKLWEDPRPFLSAYHDTLLHYWRNYFSYISYEIPASGHQGTINDAALIRVLKVLSFFAILLLFVNSRDRSFHQLAFVMAGTFLSAPFIFRGGGHRLFAATFPYIAAVPALGASFLTVLFEPKSRDVEGSTAMCTSQATAPRFPLAALILGGVLTVASVIGPSLAVAVHNRPQFGEHICAQGLRSVIFRLGNGSPFLRVMPDSKNAGRTRVPAIRFADFHADPKFGRIESGLVFRKVRPGSWVIRAYDYVPGSPGSPWLIADDSVNMPAPGEYVHICGKPDEEAFGGNVVLHVTSAKRIEPLQD